MVFVVFVFGWIFILLTIMKTTDNRSETEDEEQRQ